MAEVVAWGGVWKVAPNNPDFGPLGQAPLLSTLLLAYRSETVACPPLWSGTPFQEFIWFVREAWGGGNPHSSHLRAPLWPCSLSWESANPPQPWNSGKDAFCRPVGAVEWMRFDCTSWVTLWLGSPLTSWRLSSSSVKQVFEPRL